MSQEGVRWSRRFLGFFALCLVGLGAVMVAVSTFAHHGAQQEVQVNFKGDAAEGTLEDDEGEDGIEWTVFAVGILLLTTGLIMLTLCCICTRQAPAPAPPVKVPTKPVVLPPAHTNGSRDIIRGIPLKTSLEDLRLNHVKGDGDALADEIPAHLLHYKPRNFNQHGYGTKMAPMATMDEFDHSLRSSMNSLWSQHVHRQETESLFEESDLDDALSFHSVVIT